MHAISPQSWVGGIIVSCYFVLIIGRLTPYILKAKPLYFEVKTSFESVSVITLNV